MRDRPGDTKAKVDDIFNAVKKRTVGPHARTQNLLRDSMLIPWEYSDMILTLPFTGNFSLFGTFLGYLNKKLLKLLKNKPFSTF